MTESKLPICVPSDQEALVVDQVLEPSLDLIPGVHVTLAKRIVRPGSDRIMCLAAETSLPLPDDDIASISRLGLRLADGTNVALSLSFFNDGAIAGDVPLNRYYYDPGRYSVRDDSKLGPVIMAIILIALTGSYALDLGRKGLLGVPQFATKKTVVSSYHRSATKHVSEAKVAVHTPGVAGAISTVPAKTALTVKVIAPAQSGHAAVRTAKKEKVGRSHASTAVEPKEMLNGGMLVPPPPPTPYTWPTDLPGMTYFPGAGVPIGKPIASGAFKLNATKPQQAVASKSQAVPQEPVLSKSSTVLKEPVAVHQSNSPDDAQAPETMPTMSNTSAPMPGANAEPIQLERIVLPDQ